MNDILLKISDYPHVTHSMRSKGTSIYFSGRAKIKSHHPFMSLVTGTCNANAIKILDSELIMKEKTVYISSCTWGNGWLDVVFNLNIQKPPFFNLKYKFVCWPFVFKFSHKTRWYL